MTHTPSVLFVCVKNGGKSQIAAALMRMHAGEHTRVCSAGTHPGTSLNALAVTAVAETGVDMSQETPQALTPTLMHQADVIIILGDEAQFEIPEHVTARVERWVTVEPSTDGIEGMERMRLVRDDIDRRVRALAATLQ